MPEEKSEKEDVSTVMTKEVNYLGSGSQKDELLRKVVTRSNELTKMNTELSGRLLENEQIMATLNKDIEVLMQEISSDQDSKNKINELHKKISYVSLLNQTLHKNLETLKSDVEKKARQINLLKRQLVKRAEIPLKFAKKLNQDLLLKDKKIGVLQKQSEELSFVNKDLINNLELLKKDIIKKTNHMNLLKRQVAQKSVSFLGNKIREFRHELASKDETIGLLHKEMDSIIQKLKVFSEKSERELLLKDKKVEELQKQSEELTSVNTKLVGDLELLKKKSPEKKDQVDLLKRQVAQKSVSFLGSKIHELQQELVSKDETIGVLRQEMDNFNQKLKLFSGQSEHDLEDIGYLTVHEKQLKDRGSEQDKVIVQLRQFLGKYKQEKEIINKANRKLLLRTSELKKRLDDMKSELSTRENTISGQRKQLNLIIGFAHNKFKEKLEYITKEQLKKDIDLKVHTEEIKNIITKRSDVEEKLKEEIQDLKQRLRSELLKRESLLHELERLRQKKDDVLLNKKDYESKIKFLKDVVSEQTKEALSLKYELQSIKKRDPTIVSESLRNKEDMLLEKEVRIKNREDTLIAKEEQLEKSTKEIRDKEKKIIVLEKYAQSLSAEVELLKNQKVLLDHEVKDVNKRIGGALVELKDRENNFKDKETELKEKEAKGNKEFEDTISKLQKEFDHKTSQLQKESQAQIAKAEHEYLSKSKQLESELAKREELLKRKIKTLSSNLTSKTSQIKKNLQVINDIKEELSTERKKSAVREKEIKRDLSDVFELKYSEKQSKISRLLEDIKARQLQQKKESLRLFEYETQLKKREEKVTAHIKKIGSDNQKMKKLRMRFDVEQKKVHQETMANSRELKHRLLKAEALYEKIVHLGEEQLKSKKPTKQAVIRFKKRLGLIIESERKAVSPEMIKASEELPPPPPPKGKEFVFKDGKISTEEVVQGGPVLNEKAVSEEQAPVSAVVEEGVAVTLAEVVEEKPGEPKMLEPVVEAPAEEIQTYDAAVAKVVTEVEKHSEREQRKAEFVKEIVDEDSTSPIEEIVPMVRVALDHGEPEDQIILSLSMSGYKREDIEKAIKKIK